MSDKDTAGSKSVNPPAQPAPNPAKSGRGMKIALIVSLMLNALFAGAIGMRVYHVKQTGGWHHERPGPGPKMGMGRFFHELPKARREELRKKFSTKRVEMRAHHKASREAKEEVITLLRADTFDEEKLSAAFATLSSARGANAKRNNAYLLDVIKSLTPAERKAMADSMVRRNERREQRRRKRRERKKD